MVRKIEGPARIPVPGDKVIDEHIGRVSSGDDAISIAHMTAPPGWEEPPQRPQFTEYTVVLRGLVMVEHAEGTTEVSAGQSVVTSPGEKVRYSAGPEGAEYIAVCLPAFSADGAGRD
ncbi:cupin [Nonomuraea phyllanthi]|uniref:Cupin n=1 Tax=Nonomuraea phyllanthi TaxID=2219224 RepID=A0A5C4WW87_9ACTN|nr:cupin [Nonomuraea phyllanthi]KAB8197771.1 cupin [Nonomuraea phyllanthi]QFY06254.1 cupin [Nonomuraea phyllanthi]